MTTEPPEMIRLLRRYCQPLRWMKTNSKFSSVGSKIQVGGLDTQIICGLKAVMLPKSTGIKTSAAKAIKMT